MKQQPPLHTRLGELKGELVDAMAVLDEAGERWLELRAAGKDTAALDAEVEAAKRVTRQLEAKIHKANKGVQYDHSS